MLKHAQRPRPSRWSGTCHPFDSVFKYPAPFAQNMIDKKLQSSCVQGIIIPVAAICLNSCESSYIDLLPSVSFVSN